MYQLVNEVIGHVLKKFMNKCKNTFRFKTNHLELILYRKVASSRPVHYSILETFGHST